MSESIVSSQANEEYDRNRLVNNNQKPKLVRMSKEQPYYSESEYDNDKNSSNKNYGSLMRETEKKYASSQVISRLTETPIEHKPKQMPAAHSTRSLNKARVDENRVRTSGKLPNHQKIFLNHQQQQQQKMNNNIQVEYEDEDEDIDDEEEVTSKTEVISFTQEDYILQKILLENPENSSSTSSSDRAVLNKKKEELRLKKLLQNQAKQQQLYAHEKRVISNDMNNVSSSTYPVSSTEASHEYMGHPSKQYSQNSEFMTMQPNEPDYDSLESYTENLDTISRFPDEEQLISSIQSKAAEKPIFHSRNVYKHSKTEHIIPSGKHQNKLGYDVKVGKNKPRRSQVSDQISETIYEAQQISPESSRSYEMDSAMMVELKKAKPKAALKNEIKKELMKRLTDEVENLKQHILKNHLKKVPSQELTYKNVNKMSKKVDKKVYQHKYDLSEGNSLTQTLFL